MRLLSTTAKILFVLAGVAAAFLYAYFHQIIYTPHRVTEEKFVLVKSGDSLTQIAAELKQQNLLDEEWHFVLFSKINKIYPQIKAGEYLIDKDVSLYETADILRGGKVYQRKITFAEGLTAREIAEILYADEYLSGDFEMPSEGYFLPETYVFARGDSRQQIVRRAQKEMAEISRRY